MWWNDSYLPTVSNARRNEIRVNILSEAQISFATRPTDSSTPMTTAKKSGKSPRDRQTSVAVSSDDQPKDTITVPHREITDSAGVPLTDKASQTLIIVSPRTEKNYAPDSTTGGVNIGQQSNTDWAERRRQIATDVAHRLNSEDDVRKRQGLLASKKTRDEVLSTQIGQARKPECLESKSDIAVISNAILLVADILRDKCKLR
jgi:hypothetical protein